MSKRILSLVLTLTLVLGSFSMAFADHADTTLTRDEKIEYLKQEGFIVGNESGDDMLDAKIDRASVARILARTVLGGTGQSPAEIEAEIAKSNYQGIFKDVPKSHWANAPVNIVTEKQITVGTGQGEFSPSRNITYVEVIAMMNRILDLDVQEGNDWNMNKVYNIAAARDAGILEGIDFENFNYDDVAVRGVIFELLYNTVARHEVGNYQIDKVIVLENNRVESIGANELVVEVIEEVQRANFIKENAERRRGAQIRISVPSEVDIDTEDILGRVVDLSYDKANNAVSVIQDKSYSYESGKIVLDEKKVTVDGNSYTVLKDDRYKDSDERIFSTYVNNEDFSYDKAQKDFTGTLDFGRVTIKNGKVLFIDAFAFDDIAPVKEVRKDGSDIIVYNDENDGGEKRIELKDEKIVSFEEESVHAMNKSDIKELDVIHVGTDSKGNKAVVVRQDSQVNGEYEKVVESAKNKTVVVVDGEEYEILDVNYKRPVYSANSDEFFTLKREDASTVLKGFKGEKVTVLQDVNGDLQYIGGEIEFGEFTGLLERVVGKDARVLKSDNSTADYTATLDSKFGDIDSVNTTTGHQSLQAFNRGDLVFVSAVKEEIEKMTLLSPRVDPKVVAASVDKDGRFVTVNGTDYRVFDRTNIFVRNTKGNDVDLFTTTIENVEKYAGAGLKARVITDKEFAEQVDSRYVNNPSANVANTIVFEDVNIKKDSTEKYVELTKVSNKYESIEVKYANGNTESFNIDKSSDAYEALRTRSVIVGDIIKLSVDKDTEKIVTDVETSISINAKGMTVKKYDSRNKEITLSDDSVYFLTSETANFIKGSIEEGKTEVAIDASRGFINAIAERSVKVAEAGKGKLVEVIDQGNGKVVLKVKKVNETKDTLYEFIGTADEVTAVKALKGQNITFDSQTLNGVDYVFNVVGVTEEATKADLVVLITEAGKLKAEDYTTASFEAFEIALQAAKDVNNDADATQAEITKALNDLQAAKDGLKLDVPVGENELVGTIEEALAGDTILVDVEDASELEQITYNGKVLNPDVWEYGIDGNTIRIPVNAEVEEIVITLNGVDYSVVVK